MNELIPIFLHAIDGQHQHCVTMRDIHERGKVGRDFSNWSKDRLSMFVEGKDYEKIEERIFAKNGDNSPRGRGRPSFDYILTLDTGKHVSMMENNDLGMAIRNYLIRFEKQGRVLLEQMREVVREEVRDQLRVSGVINRDQHIIETHWNSLQIVWEAGIRSKEMGRYSGLTRSVTSQLTRWCNERHIRVEYEQGTGRAIFSRQEAVFPWLAGGGQQYILEMAAARRDKKKGQGRLPFSVVKNPMREEPKPAGA